MNETTTLNSLNEVQGLDWVQTRTGGAVDLDQYQYVYDNDGRRHKRVRSEL